MSQLSDSEDGLSATDILKKYAIPEFLKKGRNNPINGRECFFSESTFQRVVGPDPCLRERFKIQLSRAREGQSVKPESKKKRSKDLNLPDEKNSKLKTLKLSKSDDLPKTERLHNSTEAANSDSTDDDEISTNLVIVDDAAQDKDTGPSENVSPDKETCTLSVPDHSTHKLDGDGTDLGSGKSNAQQIKPAVECTDNGDIPLYATGIISLQNTSISLSMTGDGDRQENLIRTNKECAENEAGDQGVGPSCEYEGGVSLVLPPLDATDSDNDNDNSKTEIPQPSVLALPLIPALMLEPVKRTEEDPLLAERNISKLDLASKFYSADRSPAAPKSQPPHACLRAATEMPSSATENNSTLYDEDLDVPIFSVANSSDDLQRGNASRRSLRSRGIWSTKPQSIEDTSKQQSFIKDNTVKEAMKFKQSNLTREEMASYLNLFGKYVRPYLYGGCCPMFTQRQKDEMAQFEILQIRVHREQREFQAYLQQNAIRNPHYYNFTKAHIKRYAIAKTQMYRLPKNLLKKFNHVLAAKIPLQADSEQVELTFQQHLLQIGSPPKIVLPDVRSSSNPVSIPHNLKKLDQHFPSSQRNENTDILHHESVSEDTNAQTLAVKYNADAVLSSSVVKCLLDNRGTRFSRTWNIMVTIKEHQTEGVARKVVYFHKPVFEENLLLRDYNALFHKYALRVMVSHPKHTLSQGLKQQQKFKTEAGGKRAGPQAADDPFDMFTADLEALETFGKSAGGKDRLPEVSKAKSVITEGTNCRRSKRISESILGKESMGDENVSLEEAELSEEKSLEICDNMDSSSSLNDSLEHSAEQKSSRLRKRTLNLSSPCNSKNTDRDKTLDSPAKKVKVNYDLDQCTVNRKGSSSVASEKSPVKLGITSRLKQKVSVASTASNEPAQQTQPQLSFSGDASVSGNLLDLILGPDVALEETQEASFKENPSQYIPHSESLSSLVYSQWTLGQNKILIRTRSQGVRKTHNVYVTAKMEYQSNHGLEQVTAEEMVRDWAACYIRPNTKLLRARINVFSSEILMFEELEAHQILRSNSNFRPAERFSFMNNLLKHLSSLKAGNYLVSHEAGLDYCGIRAQKSGARLDKLETPLAAHLDAKSVVGGPVPWIPIDPNLLLPYHVLNERIPATFLPKDVVVASLGPKKSQKDKNATKQGSKKKKKKKFRKKNSMEREFFT